MAAKLPVVLNVLAEDLENEFFGDDNFMCFAAATSVFARRNLNRILGYFEKTLETHSLDEFKAHLIFVCRRQHVKIPTTKLNSFSPVEL